MKFDALPKIFSFFSVALWLLPVFNAQAAEKSFSFTPPSGWVDSVHLDNIKSWKEDSEKKDKSGVLTVLEDPSTKLSDKGTELEVDDKSYIEQMSEGVKVPHWIAGIHDYKIQKIEREKLPVGGQKIILTGTYVDFDNRTIQFEEWQYFLPQGYGQIEFTEIAGPQARNRTEVKKLLEGYKPFGT